MIERNVRRNAIRAALPLPAGLADTLRQAWRWWHEEMRGFTAAMTRGFTGTGIPVPLATDRDGCLHLHEGHPASDDLPGGWQDACKDRPTVILLNPEQVMRLPLALPRAARGSLAEAVRYRLAAEAPIDPAALHFSIGEVSAGKDGSEIRVEVALCTREQAARLEAAAEQAGATGCVIGFSPDGSPSPKFIFSVSRGARSALATSRLNRWLLASACGIVLAIGPALHASASWLTARTQAAIDGSRTAQGKAIRLAEEQARLRAVQDAVSAVRASPGLLQVLEDVATHLPKQAWVSQFHYEREGLRIIGHAADPTTAARALEQAGSLAAVRLESVLRPDPGTGSADMPQFVIQATLARAGAR